MIEIDDERYDKLMTWFEILRKDLHTDGLIQYESVIDDVICELEISEVDSHGN